MPPRRFRCAPSMLRIARSQPRAASLLEGIPCLSDTEIFRQIASLTELSYPSVNLLWHICNLPPMEPRKRIWLNREQTDLQDRTRRVLSTEKHVIA